MHNKNKKDNLSSVYGIIVEQGYPTEMGFIPINEETDKNKKSDKNETINEKSE